MNRILITGASGYVGMHVVEYFLGKGCELVLLVRNAESYPDRHGVSVFSYDMQRELDVGAFSGVDCLLHLAAVTDGSDYSGSRVEIDAAQKLLQASQVYGLKKCIFLSSQSAVAAETYYSRTKASIEELFLQAGGFVLRSGLVYGGKFEAGLYSHLCSLARALTVVPSFKPEPAVQLTHVDDLCKAIGIVALSYEGDKTLFSVASPYRSTMSEFLQRLAWSKFDKFILVLPLPLLLLKIAAKVSTFFRFIPGVNPERLNGLLTVKDMDVTSSLKELNLLPRSISVGAFLSERGVRDLLKEARAMVRYVSGEKASVLSLRIYVKAIMKLDNSKPLNIPLFFLQFPVLIRLLDRTGALRREDSDALDWRLSIAAAVAEASSEKFPAFSLPVGESKFYPFAQFLANISVETLFVALTSPLYLVSGFFTKGRRQ